MMPSGTSPNASADATSLIVPSPPHAITSRTPRARPPPCASSCAWPTRFGDEDFGGDRRALDDDTASCARRADRVRTGAPPAIGLMMTVRTSPVESRIARCQRLQTAIRQLDASEARAVVRAVVEVGAARRRRRRSSRTRYRSRDGLAFLHDEQLPVPRGWRCAPDRPASGSSAMPMSFSGGSARRAAAALRRARAAGSARSARNRRARRRAEREQIAAGLSRRGARPQPLVQPGDFAARARRRALSIAGGLITIGADAIARLPTSPRRRATRANAPPTMTIVAVRLTFIMNCRVSRS